MSLSHDSYTFEGGLHTPIRVDGNGELPIVRHRYFGVLGEHHLIGEMYSRQLSCVLTLKGYANKGALQAALNTLMNKKGKLTGTLTETVLAVPDTYSQCTFIGYSMIRPPMLDGSGVNGWHTRVRLMWIERAT